MLVVNGVVKKILRFVYHPFIVLIMHNGRKHLARVTGNSAGCFCYS
nr:MAG TPA: hypothetical protein [Caudoviricetes sp.]